MRGASRRAIVILATLLVAIGQVLVGWPAITSASTILRAESATNVTDTSFTVNWVTQTTSPSTDQIIFGPSTTSVNQTNPETVNPMVAGAKGDVHSVTVKLTNTSSANQTLYYSVSSSGQIDNNGGQYYSVKLGSTVPALPTIPTVTGRLLLSDGVTAAAGVVVTVWVANIAGQNGTSASLSTLTNSTGNWSLPLLPRTADGTAYFTYSTGANSLLEYSVDGGQLGQISTQTVPINFTTSNQLIVPTVNFGSSTATPTAITVTPTNTATTVATATIPPTSTPIATAIPTSIPTATEAPLPTATAIPPEAPTEAPFAPPPQQSAPQPPQSQPVAVLGNIPTIVASNPPTFTPIPQPPTPTTIPTQPPTSPPPPPAALATPNVPFAPVAPTLAPPQFPSTLVGAGTPRTASGFGAGGNAAPTPGGAIVSTLGGTATVGPLPTPTILVPTSAVAGSVPSQVETLFALSFALVVVGLGLAVYGLTRQWRRGA